MRVWEILHEDKVYKMDADKIAHLITPAVQKLYHIYKSNNFELRIVGGSVRDLVLGKKPKDIDLASNATPEESLKILNHAGIKTIPTGIEHGTISAVIDKEPYEITTLRIDVETTGRHATVEFTRDWKLDSERRDLTFNSMSLDLDGNLYDYHNGVHDLKSGIARFVGDADKRIQEDYLRILRYFRFQGRMASPRWDDETLKSIKRNADGLKQISGERVWMEISKILAGNHVSDIIKKLEETNVDFNIHLPKAHFGELERAKKHTSNPATLLVSFISNEQGVNTVASKWKLSVEERELIRFIVQHKHDHFTQDKAQDLWTNPKIKKEWILELAKFLGHEEIAKHLENWQTPVFPVTGKDLLSRGMKPGPELGKTLKDLEAEWKKSGYKKTAAELLAKISGDKDDESL